MCKLPVYACEYNSLIYFSILLFSDNVTVEFHGQDQPEFKGSKNGRLYLTTHRMIFNAKESRDKMQSFSFPFVTLKDVSSIINVVLC